MEKLKYQEDSVKDVIRIIEEINASTLESKPIVLKSVTGSGKTIMATKMISKLAKDKTEDYCFIWVSPGKGNLHIQSMGSVKKYLPKFKCSILEPAFVNAHDVIEQNEIVFFNWESTNRTEDGISTNLVMRASDGGNFIEIVKATKQLGRKIILFIDESHNTSTSKKSEDMKLNVLTPDHTIEVSATPKVTDSKKVHLVTVSTNEVIAAEMIKKKVIINDDISTVGKDYEAVKDFIIQAAVEKQKELHAKYMEEGSSIIPLILIQIPDKTKDDDGIKEEIEGYLAKHQIRYDNKSLAVWLSGKNDKINLDNIQTSGVKALIFKQAIATGWDCPRAHILVRFRDIKSEAFSIQTVGRIMRMPERKHYFDEALNVGYVYTDLPSEDIKVDKSSKDNMEVTPLISQALGEIPDFDLPSYFKKTGDQRRAIADAFIQKIERELAKYCRSNKIDLTDVDLLQTSIAVNEEFIYGDSGESVSHGSNTSVDLNEKESKKKVYEFLDSFYDDIDDDLLIIRDGLIQFLANKYSITKLHACAIIINRDELFKNTIESLLVVKENIKAKLGTKTYKWNPKDKKFGQNSQINLKTDGNEYQKSLMQPFYDKIEPSELAILDMFENNPDIVQFYRNNTEPSVNNFGIDNGNESYYPEYIVLYNNQTIGVYSLVEPSDTNVKTSTNLDATVKYINSGMIKDIKGNIIKSKRKMIGGVLCNVNGNIMLYDAKANRSKKFRNYNTTPGLWTKF